MVYVSTYGAADRHGPDTQQMYQAMWDAGIDPDDINRRYDLLVGLYQDDDGDVQFPPGVVKADMKRYWAFVYAWDGATGASNA